PAVPSRGRSRGFPIALEPWRREKGLRSTSAPAVGSWRPPSCEPNGSYGPDRVAMSRSSAPMRSQCQEIRGRSAMIRTIGMLGMALVCSVSTALDVSEASFDSNGVRIHYTLTGSGEPVVLIHGWAASGQMWEPLAADLARTHRVIVPD